MFNCGLIQIEQVPRGPEHSPPIALPDSVNTARRRANVVTMSAFDPHYDSLHELRTNLKPKITSITEAATSLLTLSKSDEITQLATATSTAIIDAQIIVNKYIHSVNQLRKSIDEMDEDKSKLKEQKTFEEQMEAEDAGNLLPIGDVSLQSLMSQTKDRYHVALTETVERVKLLSSLHSCPSPSLLPAGNNLDSSSLSSHVPTGTVNSSSPDSSPHGESIIINQLFHSINQLATQISSSNTRPNVALPPVKLETFDGTDLTRWPAFHYQIKQLILTQPHLTEVEKAFYLRSSLKGVAFNLVASIPVHENFLEKIVSRLESQYGRHNLSQAKLIQSLRSIRSKSPSVSDQLTAVQSMISIAHSIHSESGIDSLCMQQIFAECVNPRFVTFIGRQKPKSLLAALELIENELLTEYEDALTISAFTSLPQSTVNSTTSTESNSSINHLTQQSPQSLQSNHSLPHPKSPNKPCCVYCGNHSYSGECTQVPSIKDRIEILRQKSLCYSCFSPTHLSNDCTRSCPTCKGKHHKSLCDKSSVAHTSVNTITVDHPIQVKNRLFTSPVMLTNPAATKCSMANALLDPGAQISLISRKLAKTLQLPSLGFMLLSISGLRGSHGVPDNPSYHDIVEFQMVTDRGKETIKAAVRDTDSIIGSIHHPPLSSADLAAIESTLTSIPNHFTDSSVCPDLLLGVGDSLKLLDSTKSTTLPSGYRLVKTIIGPLIAGTEHISSSIPDRTYRTQSTTVVSVDSLATSTDNSPMQIIEPVNSVISALEATDQDAHKSLNSLNKDPPWYQSEPAPMPKQNHYHPQCRNGEAISPQFQSLKVASVTATRPCYPMSSHSHSSHSFTPPFITTSSNQSSSVSFPSPEDSIVRTQCNFDSFTYHHIPASPRSTRVRWTHRRGSSPPQFDRVHRRSLASTGTTSTKRSI